jgi:hypothetical protein
MIVGYARTSTVCQIAGFEAQLKELQAAGCEKIFREQVSSVAVRAQLQAALESLGVLFPAACGDVKNIFLVDTPSACGGVVHFVREGDVLVVTKLIGSSDRWWNSW